MNLEINHAEKQESMTTEELINWVTGGRGREGSGRREVRLKYLPGSGQSYTRSKTWLIYEDGKLFLSAPISSPKGQVDLNTGDLLQGEQGNWADHVKLEGNLFTYSDGNGISAETINCLIIPVEDEQFSGAD